MPDSQWILYGVNGYTGRCIAEEASRRGLRPVVAGRSAGPVRAVALEFNLDHRVFGLDEAATLRESLRGSKLVLNCAGPFSATAGPLMAACLAEGAHYLDITGEIDVIESAAALDASARSAGITLLPAVGFDVVPTDCLAAKLAARLPDATELLLAIAGMTSVSRGTAKTMLESAPSGGRVRIDGRIVPVPLAWKTREVPFRDRSRTAMTIPWGDVSSAYHSTGIGNIEVYAAASPRQIKLLRRWRWALPAVSAWPMNALARWAIERREPGPSAENRDRETSSIWGCVTNRRGERVEATLSTPNGYALTIMTALAAVERILRSSVPTGFLTPSRAFGADFITSFPGCDFQFTENA